MGGHLPFQFMVSILFLSLSLSFLFHSKPSLDSHAFSLCPSFPLPLSLVVWVRGSLCNVMIGFSVDVCLDCCCLVIVIIERSLREKKRDTQQSLMAIFLTSTWVKGAAKTSYDERERGGRKITSVDLHIGDKKGAKAMEDVWHLASVSVIRSFFSYIQVFFCSTISLRFFTLLLFASLARLRLSLSLSHTITLMTLFTFYLLDRHTHSWR